MTVEAEARPTVDPSPPDPDTDPTARRRKTWRSRPGLARTIRVVTGLLPLLAPAVAALVVAQLLPQPATTAGAVGWWSAVLVTGLVAAIGVRRLVVGLLPMAVLYRLGLDFPGQAPARLRLARGSRSVDEARRRLEAMDATAPVQAASEAAVALVVALETHDARTRGHSERVRIYADLIGEELGLDGDERRRLRWAGLLHDLGKLQVHADVLNKPGRPTEAEWEALRQHPIEGARLVRPLERWLGPWSRAVVEHHERYDGGGYPHGLGGAELSLGGRIVCVADAYETMTARRSYKAPMSTQEARAELVACAGSQFDPKVVRAFLSLDIPRPSRWALAAAWLAEVPAVAWLLQRRGGRRVRDVAAGGTVALAVAASGLAPGDNLAAPDPASTPSTSVEAPASSIEEADGPRMADADGPTPVAGETGQTPRAPSSRPDQGTPPNATLPRTEPSTSQGPEGSSQHHPPASRGETLGERLDLGAWSPGSSTERPRMWPLLQDPTSYDGPVPNYDQDIDARSGLRLTAGEPRGARWALEASGPLLVSGSVRLVYWTVLDRVVPDRAEVRVRLRDCDADLVRCTTFATARDRRLFWAGGGWSRHTVELEPVSRNLEPGRVLVVQLDAGRSEHDVLVAFATRKLDSRLEGIVLDVPLPTSARPDGDYLAPSVQRRLICDDAHRAPGPVRC